MATALVTGATSGIGAAFARRLAADGYDLVLVARNADRLRAMADELSAHDISTEVLPADLSTDDGCAAVEQRLRGGVDLLVNNAGFTTHAPFDEADRADEDMLIRVNVLAVMRLAHAALPAMLAAGGGQILNVSSVAGFWPTAGGVTYGASKAYVTAFSQGLAAQYGGRGVTIMALCPGFTRTELHQRAGIPTEGIPDRFWLSAEFLVDEALKDLRKGRAVSVPGRAYQVAAGAGKVLPGRVAVAIGQRAQKRRGRK